MAAATAARAALSRCASVSRRYPAHPPQHPYKLVKDVRTGVQTSDVQAVLDGGIDAFLQVCGLQLWLGDEGLLFATAWLPRNGYCSSNSMRYHRGFCRRTSGSRRCRRGLRRERLWMTASMRPAWVSK